ncbi:response regulator [Desulfobacterales bacterium HSG2]|nr:response regulator [Desulfobacterales bacterium HSG2]
MERRYKILIVDEEDEIRSAYGKFLAEHGFEVGTAYRGSEGLKKLREEAFDVALVDLKIPETGGISMIRVVVEEGIDTDTVILSRGGSKEDVVQALNLGVGGWFEKDEIRMGELLKKVRELAEVMPLEDVRRILSAIPDEEFQVRNGR